MKIVFTIVGLVIAFGGGLTLSDGAAWTCVIVGAMMAAPGLAELAGYK